MCGRFVLESPVDLVAREFHARPGHVEYSPRYNIAPWQDVAIVIDEGGNVLETCKWGFVPAWARDLSSGCRMINARAESVAEKPAFREAFRQRRCLVPADGFYEWKRTGGRRIPYYVRLRSRRPFAFAGLYNVWTAPGGGELRTCAIITTEANGLVRAIHDRMPVILGKDAEARWHRRGDADVHALLSLLAPYDPSGMEAYEVSPAMNSAAHDSPENIRPAAAGR